MTFSTITKTTLLLCLFFLSNSLSAQKNFTNGFIVSLKGDTTRGLINYNNWRKNPNSISFKSNDAATVNTYSAEDISAFGVNIGAKTELYKAAKVKIENSAETIDKMDQTRQFDETQANIFLLKLYAGTYSLYSYTNEKEHLFIGKSDDISELRFKNYLQNNAVIKVEQYKAQLIDLLKSCTKITTEEINRLEFRSSAIIGLLKEYDNCVGTKSELQFDKEKAKFGFGVVLATDASTLKISGPSQDLKFNSVGNFAIGTSLALVLPRNNRSSSINLELLFRKYGFEKTISNTIDNDRYFIHYYNLSGNYFKTNLLYRYQFTRAKLKPFINVGLSQALKFSKIDRSTTEKKFYTTVSNYDDPILADERSYEQGLNLGFGINVKKVNIELRGETTNGYSAYASTKTNIKSFYLNLNYIIK